MRKISGHGTVFHYAPVRYLAQIIESGYLRPSNAGAPLEPPLLWFSANQFWEPTATKMVATSTGLRSLSFTEQRKKFGCMRFGMSSGDARLMSWSEACNFAGIRRDQRRALERTGRRQGAQPEDWFAVATRVPIGELDFEFLDDRWKTMRPEECLEALRALAARVDAPANDPK